MPVYSFFFHPRLTLLEWQQELWWTLVFVRPELTMATVLSLPRLPVASPPLSASASSRLPTSQCSFCNFRHPIWSAIASERTSVSCTAVDGASSSSWIGVERNVGLEHASRSCSGEEQGACTTSGEESMAGRREVILGAAVLGMFAGGGEAWARDRRNKKAVLPEDYLTSGTIISYHLWER